MINIELDVTPEFSTKVGNDVSNGEWNFDPASILELISFIGDANLADFDVATTIKDYIDALGTTYDKYFVQLEIGDPTLNGNVTSWSTVTGEIADATGDGYEILSNNLAVTNAFTLYVLNMPISVSTTRLTFNVYGKNGANPIEFIEKEDYYVTLRRLDPKDINVNAIGTVGAIEWSHVIGGSLPASRNVLVSTRTTFTITVGDHVVLSGGNIVLDSDVDGVKTYSGSDTQTLVFTLELSIEGEQNINPYYYAEAVFISSSGDVDVQGVRVFVYESSEKGVYPLNLAFTAIKEISEPANQPIYISGAGSFTVTAPNWMELPYTSGENNQTMYLKPIHSSSLGVGLYEGDVVIDHGGTILTVGIVLNVFDAIDDGFSANKVNFTKDLSGITEVAGLNSNVMEVELSVEAFGYNVLSSNLNSGKFKKGIFKNRTDMFLGNKVEKAMQRIDTLIPFDLDMGFNLEQGNDVPVPFRVIKYYNPSLSEVNISFKDRETGVYNGEFRNIQGLQFIKGRKPERFYDTVGIVDYNESYHRVTRLGYTILNMFRSNGISKVDILRNGIAYTSIYPERGDYKLFGVIFNFANFSDGDIIDAYITNNNAKGAGVGYSQRYVVFPAGKHSYHIGWEDEHGLLQVFEFTGDYKIPVKYESLLFKTYTKYVERTVKSGTVRGSTFVANTGHVLKQSEERIDSLCASKRAWLIREDGTKVLELVPMTKGVNMVDSDLANYNYTINFEINLGHELENHSF